MISSYLSIQGWHRGHHYGECHQSILSRRFTTHAVLPVELVAAADTAMNGAMDNRPANVAAREYHPGTDSRVVSGHASPAAGTGQDIRVTCRRGRARRLTLIGAGVTAKGGRHSMPS